MEILENIGTLARLVNQYEPLYNAGLLTEAVIDDVEGLDTSLADLDKNVDSLQSALDVYIEIFDGLGNRDQLAGNVPESQEAAKKCSDALNTVRGQLDDISQLDMGKISAIGDFFGKDSSYKKALDSLAQISAELSKIHSISAGSAAAAARLIKRAKVVKELDDPSIAGKGLSEPQGFFAKNDIAIKDVLKQVKRTAKSMLPSSFQKMGGFFKGLVGGKKEKPLFGLSAEIISTAIMGIKAEKFNEAGEKMVSLGNDISKFGESIAKYKEKEKELKKIATADQRESEKMQAAIDKISSSSLIGRSGNNQSYADRIKDALKLVGDDMKDKVEKSLNALHADFSKMVAESKKPTTYKMNLDFLFEGEDEPTEESEPPDTSTTDPDNTEDEIETLSDDEFEALEAKIADKLVDDVDGIEATTAADIAKTMLESHRRFRTKSNFYRQRSRALKLAGIKG